MRILYVQDTDWIRRNPIQHTHLAERLVQRGHEVCVIDYEILWRTEGRKELLSRRLVRRVARLLPGGDVTVVRPPIVKIPLLDYASMLVTHRREIERQISEFGPDVIIGDAILTTALGYRAARKHRIPTLYYILDVNPRLIPFAILRPLGRFLERRNIRAADAVLAINQGLRDYAISRGARADRSAVLTAGIDRERRGGLSRQEVRRRYGLGPDDTVLIFVGWIHHGNALPAVAGALAAYDEGGLKLLVVGDGDGYADLERARGRLNLHDRLILAGRRPYSEVPELIGAADFCLLPSRPDEAIMQDIVPIKMYDYMGMGKPVIASRLPGILREFGEDSGVVYVDRPEDVVARAGQLTSAGAGRELGDRARAFIERYDWDGITDEFERRLRELAGGRIRERVPQRV